MIDIDRLRLQMPDGFEHRAGRIARLVGNHLAQSPMARNRDLAQLSVGPVRISRGAGDGQIARDIARAIQQQLDGGV